MLSTCVSLVIGIASGDRRYRRALGDGTAQRLHYAQQTHMLLTQHLRVLVLLALVHQSSDQR
jgi:hypothetical protein